MTDPSYLKSAAHFHHYESYVARVVQNWPLLSVFKPEGQSTESLAFHIRQAVEALRNQHHDSMVPFAKFIQLCDELVITTGVAGVVVCGPESLVRKQVPTGDLEPCITQVVPKINLFYPEHDLVKAVILMHSVRQLSEPSRITTGDDNYLRQMCDIYGVTLSQDPVNQLVYTIL